MRTASFSGHLGERGLHGQGGGCLGGCLLGVCPTRGCLLREVSAGGRVAVCLGGVCLRRGVYAWGCLSGGSARGFCLEVVCLGQV